MKTGNKKKKNQLPILYAYSLSGAQQSSQLALYAREPQWDKMGMKKGIENPTHVKCLCKSIYYFRSLVLPLLPYSFPQEVMETCRKVTLLNKCVSISLQMRQYQTKSSYSEIILIIQGRRGGGGDGMGRTILLIQKHFQSGTFPNSQVYNCLGKKAQRGEGRWEFRGWKDGRKGTEWGAQGRGEGPQCSHSGGAVFVSRTSSLWGFVNGFRANYYSARTDGLLIVTSLGCPLLVCLLPVGFFLLKFPLPLVCCNSPFIGTSVFGNSFWDQWELWEAVCQKCFQEYWLWDQV